MKDKTSYTVEQVKAVDWCRCGNLDVDLDRLMATAVELKAALARVSELEKVRQLAAEAEVILGLFEANRKVE